jgi:hypothetical protein
VACGEGRVLGGARPERPARFALGEEAVGADEAVAIRSLPVLERDRVQHAVTVERVIEARRRQQRILRVAQVDPVQVPRNLALDLQIPGVVFDGLGPPRSGPVGVGVVVREPGREALVDLGLHRLSVAPMPGRAKERKLTRSRSYSGR